MSKWFYPFQTFESAEEWEFRFRDDVFHTAGYPAEKSERLAWIAEFREKYGEDSPAWAK